MLDYFPLIASFQFAPSFTSIENAYKFIRCVVLFLYSHICLRISMINSKMKYVAVSVVFLTF